MWVREAKAIAREWVQAVGSQVAGFRGAFFHGSIDWMEEEDWLPETSDVDVMVVVEGPTQPAKLGKLVYRGVMLEVSYLPETEVRTAEQVLGVSYLAGSLHRNSLIADPSGSLGRLQAQVSAGYAKREWVERRCAYARQKALANLEALNTVKAFHDQVNHWLFGAGVSTHILLVAGLKNPTVRKRYLAVRELLAEYHQLDFYPALLDMLGCTQMDQARAETHLNRMAEAFDAASAVIRTPFPFAGDISRLGRPVAIDGSRALIDRGDQREAVFWMAVTYTRCQAVLFQDAPADVQERYTPGYRNFMADLGIHRYADLSQRCQLVRERLPQVWQVAQAIMAANPDING